MQQFVYKWLLIHIDVTNYPIFITFNICMLNKHIYKGFEEKICFHVGNHPLITYMVFIDEISAAMYVNMPRFLNYKTDINLFYFGYLFLGYFKNLLLWYCLKFSL